jgi:hypothetical protein
MTSFVLVLLLVLSSSLVAADPQPIALDDPAWKPLFTALAAKGPVFSTFTERRYSKVRKTPVILEGEMRLSPDRGLSLRYLKSNNLMIIDAQGIFLRNASGRTREVRDNSSAFLLSVLRFDLPALARLFEVRGSRDGDTWRLEFIPRSADTSLKTLTVTGLNESVTALEFTTPQRIEITLTHTETGVPFPASDLTQFFR